MNCLTKLFQQKRRRIGYIQAFSGPMISKRDSSENRKIRERLNKEILLHYLKKMGISFWDIDKSVTDYFIVKRSV